MNLDKGNKKQAGSGNVVISEQKNKKGVNPISITIIILSVAIGGAVIHFQIMHWSIAAPVCAFLLILV